MEFEIVFDTDSELALVRARDIMSLEDSAAFLQEFVSDPRWRRGMDILVDCTDVDASNITTGNIEVLVKNHFRVTDAIGPGRCAIATGSLLKYGLGRMFEAHAFQKLLLQTRIFTTVEEAFTWLRTSDLVLDP